MSCRCLSLDAPRQINCSAVQQKFFCQSGFPGIRVGNNGKGPSSVYFLRIIVHVLFLQIFHVFLIYALKHGFTGSLSRNSQKRQYGGSDIRKGISGSQIPGRDILSVNDKRRMLS